jgi:hypothetical protein
MADRTVYVLGLNKFYLTNKTNVTRLWEVVERELGQQELVISYKKDEADVDYTTTPARKHKIKQLCIDAYRNRLLIHPVDEDPWDDTTECISVQQDLLGGRD